MIAAHVDALLALLEVPNTDIYDGSVPASPSLPYVVVYADQGGADTTSLAAVSDWRQFRMQTTCVGENQAQVRALAERVEAALLDVRPTVAGRSCAPIRKEISQPVRRDDDVTPAVLYAVDTWALSSVPA